jgi:hypothetical protein
VPQTPAWGLDERQLVRLIGKKKLTDMTLQRAIVNAVLAVLPKTSSGKDGTHVDFGVSVRQVPTTRLLGLSLSSQRKTLEAKMDRPAKG